MALIVWSRTVKDSTFLTEDLKNVYNARADYGRGWKNLFSHARFMFFVFRRLHFIKPRIIYACDMDTLLPSIIWSFNKNVVIIFDQFDPYDSRIRNQLVSSLIGKIEMYLAKKTDIRITANKLRIPERNREEWFELKNFFNFDIEPKIFDKQNHRFILFYGGILAPDRGLISCASAVTQNSDWELHLYGQGLISHHLTSGQYRNVFVHEPVRHKELMQAANQSDLMLAMYDPSQSNNKFTASNKLFEAAQLGVPLITSKNTQLGEVVEKYKLGWCVEHNNASEISALLAKYKSLNREKKLDIQINLRNFLAKELSERRETICRLSRFLTEKMET